VILSKKDLHFYLKSDKDALGAGSLKDYFFHDIWCFQKLLRKTEYWNNCYKGGLGKYISFFYRVKLKRKGRKLGFSIPINTFGPGLSIAHAGTIVVNSNAQVGANCRVHVCVNIGAAINDSYAVPHIGDDCYLAPGVKIYGKITIGNNTAIGANAVVNKSFLEGNQTVAGIPARVISNVGPLQTRSFSVQKRRVEF